MSRRSARLKTAVVRSEPGDFDSESEPLNHEEDDEEFETNATTSTKRRRNTTAANTIIKRPRGIRGKLQQLTEFPLDVLFEIFGHLSPLDVLRLARTTKALRGILMSRSAIFIWKQARANEDIPDCPSDLNEAQYANLAYDPHCHFCLAHVSSIFWACRTRCCKNCLNEHYFNEYYIKSEYNLPFHPSKFLSSCSRMTQRHRQGPIFYSARQAEILMAEYTQVKDDEAQLRQWTEEKLHALHERMKHASVCEAWHYQRNQDRSREIGDIRQRRKDAIYEKLRDLGWGKDVDLLDHRWAGGLQAHPLVKKSQELTERIWNNIKDTLIEFLEDAKMERRRKTRMDRVQQLSRLLSAYSTTRPISEVVPSVADIAYIDAFRATIESPTEGVSGESFSEAMAELPRYTGLWRRSIDQELIALMDIDMTHLDPSEIAENEGSPALELATTFFKCSSCPEPMSYPRIVAHQHMTLWQSRDVDQPKDEFADMLPSQRWNHGGKRVAFNHVAYNTARSIVETCGLDPDTTTASEMDDANYMVECFRCRDSDGTRLVMRWRWAVLHASTHHSEEPSCSWLLMAPDDTALARALEARGSYSGVLDISVRCSLPPPVKLPMSVSSEGPA